ncbi:fibronectin type III domain-containing protein [Micromonospora sp. NPDC006766]|uniref:fibronectin type III domain-containing protein n=1 Tax=Micromonospora sp. NPDC006766 TaxID=3154778 RepID=UPI003409406D
MKRPRPVRQRATVALLTALLMGAAALLQATPAQAGINICEGPTPPPICGTPLPPDEPPVGGFDYLKREGDYLVATGWALDPDTPDPISVQVTSDGVRPITATADRWVNWLGLWYPGHGDYHGFVVYIPARETEGDQRVCVTANNVGSRYVLGTSLGCKTYKVLHDPVGELAEVTRNGDTVRVRGWAADPDDWMSAIDVRIYHDDVFARSVTANLAYAREGEEGRWHGFDVTDLPTNKKHGTHTVCVYGMNLTPGGRNPQIGCKSYEVDSGLRPPTIRPIKDSEITSKTISLNWTNHSTNHTGYRIERSDAGGAWREIVRLPASAQSFTSPGLTPNTRYCYRVIVYNADDEMAAETCATTLYPPLPWATDLKVTGSTDSTLTVQWTDNAVNEDSYEVLWTPEAQTPWKWTSVSVPARAGTGGTMSHTITGLAPFTQYRIWIQPINPRYEQSGGPNVLGWTSGAPKIVTVNPSVPTIQACTNTPVSLTWKTTGATRVVVKRGNTVLVDRSQAAPVTWEDSANVGSYEGNVSLDITAHGPDGRTVTQSVFIPRVSTVQLVRSITWTNIGYHQLEAWYFTPDGSRLQKIGNVAPGQHIVIRPEHCLLRYIKIIDPQTNRVAYEYWPYVLGHNEGIDMPALMGS